jgi:hypothetical protein
MNRRRNVYANVWDRVDKSAGVDGCWPFMGARNNKGYGQMRVNGKMFPAHRVAFIVASGCHPGPLFVLHRCDNPPCCNPAHLFLGTAGDNIRDCAAKGRTARGESHRASKLTKDVVGEIRRLSSEGVQGLAIARRFGVTPQTISHIVTRKTWRHV